MRPAVTLRNAVRAAQTADSLNLPMGLRLLPAAAWMGLIFVLSSHSQLPDPLGPNLTAVAGHLFAYGVLAILLWWGLVSWGHSPGWRLSLAFIGAVVYGLTDEWHQSFVPGRDPTLLDVVIDGVGAVVGVSVVHLLARRRSKAQFVSERSTE